MLLVSMVRETASMLPPSKQLDNMFGMAADRNEEQVEVSSTSEMDSSFNIVDDSEVLDAVEEVIRNFDKMTFL